MASAGVSFGEVVGYGGVVCDECGVWLNHDGLFIGLQVAWNSEYRKVMAEVDNKSVVSMIVGEMKDVIVQGNIIVAAIKELLSREWDVDV